MNIVNEVNQLTRGYSRKGGKKNRRQQRSRMLKFAEFCRERGARKMAEVGKRHVIKYWKATRHLSHTTRLNHWYAIRQLWQITGKPGLPPRPWNPSDEKQA